MNISEHIWLEIIDFDDSIVYIHMQGIGICEIMWCKTYDSMFAV